MSDDARERAYEDALRGIAAAVIAARRERMPSHDALRTMLTDVEHHLSSLVVLGYVPPDTGRAVTTSSDLRLDGPAVEHRPDPRALP